MKISKINRLLGIHSGLLKSSLILIPLGLPLLTAQNAFAQTAQTAFAQEDEASAMGDDEEFGMGETDDGAFEDMLSELDDYGDDDEPDLPGRPPKPRKVVSKIALNYGAKESLRWKINKQAFIDGYVDQAIATQDNPYKSPSSKFAFGVTGNYLWNGFTLTAGADFKRGYADVYGAWDGVQDATYSLGVSRKISLNKQWTLSPSLKQTTVRSDTASKDLSRTAISLPLSYAVNKRWTIKALTLGYATQTYTNRLQGQTDKTMSYSTGAAYKMSENATLELGLSRETRTSDQSSAEYSKTTITPKFDYKISSTSSFGIGFGYETHTTSKEESSRWVIVPKIQFRKDI